MTFSSLNYIFTEKSPVVTRYVWWKKLFSSFLGCYSRTPAVVQLFITYNLTVSRGAVSLPSRSFTIHSKNVPKKPTTIQKVFLRKMANCLTGSASARVRVWKNGGCAADSPHNRRRGASKPFRFNIIIHSFSLLPNVMLAGGPDRNWAWNLMALECRVWNHFDSFWSICTNSLKNVAAKWCRVWVWQWWCSYSSYVSDLCNLFKYNCANFIFK